MSSLLFAIQRRDRQTFDDLIKPLSRNIKDLSKALLFSQKENGSILHASLISTDGYFSTRILAILSNENTENGWDIIHDEEKLQKLSEMLLLTQDNEGDTPLHIAAFNNHENQAKQLLKLLQDNPQTTNKLLKAKDFLFENTPEDYAGAELKKYLENVKYQTSPTTINRISNFFYEMLYGKVED